MRPGWLLGAVTAAGLFAVCASQATPVGNGSVNLAQMTLGYTYFNRPGADVSMHNADVAACALEAAKVRSVDETLPPFSQGLVEPLIEGAIARASHHGLAAASLENCMVVKGWRVVLLPESEGQSLSQLAPSVLAARLAPWMSATDPPGQVVRTWDNDALKASTNRYGLRPDHTNSGQLSLLAVTASNLKQFEPPVPPAKPVKSMLDRKWPTKSLKSSELGSAPPEGGIILIRIKNLSFHGGIGLFFNRMSSDPVVSPSTIDHGPDLLAVMKGMLLAHKEGDVFAYAVPAGRWRIYGTISGLQILNFCLGAPSFEVRAGDVVYAGSFDFTGDLAPDLDPGPARDWLAGQPQAGAVRAAVYANGARGPCGNNSIYALEVKGAPFQPGYVWGSAAQAIGPPLGTR